MLVKSFKGANEDTAVLQDAPHPVVDVLQHLAALTHSQCLGLSLRFFLEARQHH